MRAYVAGRMFQVEVLQRKGLLESVKDATRLEFNIHDLYFDFAKAEAGTGPFKKRRFLLHKGGRSDDHGVPHELLKYPSGGCWPSLERLVIHNSEARSLKKAKLELCKNVEVLVLRFCNAIEEIDVTGMDNLRCIVVTRCAKLGKWVGLEDLSYLAVFHRVFSIHSSIFRTPWLEPPDFSRTNLLELTISNDEFRNYKRPQAHLRGFVKYLPLSVKKINISRCPYDLGMSPISLMTLLTNLEDLNLEFNLEITDLTDLGKLCSLQKLNVGRTGISSIPSGLGNLIDLHHVDVCGCEKLTSIAGIVEMTSLQRVDARGCRSLWDLPDGMSNLEKLEMLDVRKSSLLTLPRDYKWLAGYPGSDGILKVNVGNCWELFEPLLDNLKEPKMTGETCVESCVCRGVSIQSWIDGKRAVDGAAFELLGSVLGHRFGCTDVDRLERLRGTLNLHDVDLNDIFIRALCEHHDRLDETLPPGFRVATFGEEWVIDDEWLATMWYTVVATAPCTLRAVTKRAALQPWRKTLLHLTITEILPLVVEPRYRKDDSFKSRHKEGLDIFSDEISERMEFPFISEKGMVAVLEECRKKLEEAWERGVDLVHTTQGLKIVDAFLTKSSSSWMNTDNRHPKCYEDLFPNAPFEVLKCQDLYF